MPIRGIGIKPKTWSVSDFNLISTTSTTYVDIPNLELTINLDITANLIFFFTLNLSLDTVGKTVYAYCTGDTSVYSMYTAAEAAPDGQRGTISCIGYKSEVSPGSYTYKIKWEIYGGGATAYSRYKRFTILAVPI